ncbi:MAG: hypothetical protein ACYS9X_33050, partial [Planctomycetota bacterium]
MPRAFLALLALSVVPVLSSPSFAARPVALVRGSFSEAEDPAGEGPAAARAFGLVSGLLERAGVPFDTVTDEEVAAGALKGSRVAILPYSPKLAPGQREALGEFVKSGGKAIAFFVADGALRRALGVGALRFRSRKRGGEFAEMRFDTRELELAPRAVFQDSWNILEVTPAAGARVLARWHDAEGAPVETRLASPPGASAGATPAIVAGPGGAFVTHVMLGPATGRKAAMLLALTAEFGGGAVVEPAARAR